MASSCFFDRLSELASSPHRRHWILVAEDQLSDQLGPLARLSAETVGIVLIESLWKARLRPYHRQRLALQWANQRHFALEQAARGVAVRYLLMAEPFSTGLGPIIAELGPLRMVEPAEREMRTELAPWVEKGDVIYEPHTGFLTTSEQFQAACPVPPYRMDAFYRCVRRETGVLMQGDRPEGGRYSYDDENRKPWRGDPPAPAEPAFPVDEIKLEVVEWVRAQCPDHPGAIHVEALPATKADAESLWQFALRECMPYFGPYEDAMSHQSRGLFHTRISALLNMHRLLPERVVREVAAAEHIPLASREGFVRQILGWREFVRHVHQASDGFRALHATQGKPGDAGWGVNAGEPWPVPQQQGLTDGGVSPATWPVQSLPPAFWGKTSGFNCLDRVVSDVWETGYGHHITRLMVLSNLATLLDLDPREVADWFWVAYTDAWDWVVEPNVLGMGMYALGAHMTTKPYIAGSGYVSRMSDYCGACAFDPKKNCPLTALYWAYWERHSARVEAAGRAGPVLAAAKKRTPEQRQFSRAVFEAVSAQLARGERLTPGGLAAVSSVE